MNKANVVFCRTLCFLSPRKALLRTSPRSLRTGTTRILQNSCSFQKDETKILTKVFTFSSTPFRRQPLPWSRSSPRLFTSTCPALNENSGKTLSDYQVWKNGGGSVHCEAKVDESAVVEIGAVVQAHAKISNGVRVGSGSVVGSDVSIGENTNLHFNVSLNNCDIGKDCILHNGVCVGQDGFGFLVDPATGEVIKKPQELRVVIGANVEVGAGSCIDRGSWRDTSIGDNTKIDNLVQVGHNAHIGRCCFLCGHVALGGSSTLGDYVVMAGKSAVKDHITVCSQVRVAAKSGVVNDITEPGDYAGFPALPAKIWRRQMVEARRQARKLEDSKSSKP